MPAKFMVSAEVGTEAAAEIDVEVEVEVEVVCALPTEQTLLRVRVAVGTTVAEAIRLSGLLARCPDIDITMARVGIFGQIVTLNTALKADDRIEIYRPLIVDPKDARRRRAAKRAARQTLKS